MRSKIKVSIGVILTCGCLISSDTKAEINEKPLGNPVQEIMTIGFWVDQEGGIYKCPNIEPGCRYAEYIRPLLRSESLKKLTLIAEKKYTPNPVYDQELLTLYKEAGENQKVIVIKRPCSDCKCKDGMTSDIYDYQEKEVEIKTSKETYNKGEKVSFSVNNLSDFDRYFRVVTAERLVDEKWKEAIWNAVCGCGSLCDYVGYAKPGKTVTMSWDQTIFDKACVNAPAGRYRFVILDLYGWKDKDMCEKYNSLVYSDIFEIKG